MTERTTEALEALCVKAVDGVLTNEERAELERHLEADPELRAALEQDMDIKALTDGLAHRMRADAYIEPPRPSPTARGVLGTGFTLILGAVAVLAGYALYAVLRDPEVPMAVRGGVVALVAGVSVLLGYVVRLRLRAHGRDPYTEVDR